MKNKKIKKILYWAFVIVLVLLLIGMKVGILPVPLISNRFSISGVITVLILIAAALLGWFLKFWDEL